MAYAQFVCVTLICDTACLKIQNAKVNSGKFHRAGREDSDKDVELLPTDIDKIEFSGGQIGFVCACGRSNAMVGTDGSFEVWYNDTPIGKYEWSSPYTGAPQSTWTSTDKGDAQNPPLFSVRFSPGTINSTTVLGITSYHGLKDVQIEFY